MTKRHLILTGSVAAVLVAIMGAGLATGSFLFPNDPITRPAVESELGEKVASFPSQAGRPDAAVHIARSADAGLCVNATGGDRRSWSGGCNPARDPLGGLPFMALFTYDGGPAAEHVKEARLYGLADKSVRQLSMEMTDGSARPLRLSANPVAGTAYRVFAERVSPNDLRSGITPTAVVAYDASGAEIGRQPTGLRSSG